MNVKQCLVLGALVAVVVLFYNNFCFAKNITPSLPQKYWLIAKGKKPKRGDYICFTLSEETAKKNNLPSSIKFTKQVVGVEGDRVTLKNRGFYINDKYVATAKTHSLKGEPLSPGSTGVLGKGQYYVFTPHKDSFDSRYENMGWVNQEQVVGVAYPLRWLTKNELVLVAFIFCFSIFGLVLILSLILWLPIFLPLILADYIYKFLKTLGYLS